MQQKMISSLFVKKRTLGNAISRFGRYCWHVWRRTPVSHPRKLIPYVSTLLVLLAILPGPDVRASIRMPHVEWLAAAPPALKTAPADTVNDYVLGRGDVSSEVLQSMGFSYPDVLAMRDATAKVFSFRKLRSGHRIQRTDEGGVTRVWYDVDADQRLQLERNAEGQWQASLQQRPLRRFSQHTHGVIEDSLFLDAQKAGLDDGTTMALIDVFAWDIDFARNIRKGDSFDVYYEEAYDDRGELVSSTILAAEFVNRGQAYSAVRYLDRNGHEGYYALDGSNLKKDFLKAPVKYSRISSRFSSARKHPILGYTRAHQGVDYAAPTGTPIHAVADGIVREAGRHGGYGRYLRVDHRKGINTRYGHLSSYAKGIHNGVHVSQGQIIGYVGMSGLATGPHLHFEYRQGNKAINPLSIRSEPGRPIAKSEMARFEAMTAGLYRSMKELAEKEQAEPWG